MMSSLKTEGRSDMLTKRIVPCLDVAKGRVVKGVRFNNLKRVGDPATLARAYYQQGADEIVYLDIRATPESREAMLNVIKRTAKQVFVPLTVGGGINSIDRIKRVLRAGADKVAINTAAVKRPRLIRAAAKKFGSQCVVVAIDAKAKNGGRYEVYVRSGKEATGIDVVSWAKKVEMLGAGEILLTCIDADGTRSGFDIELTRAVSQAVNIPVIASGGASSPKDIFRALTSGGADAALAASIFHYRRYTVADVKMYLERRGVAIRGVGE